MWVNTCCYCWIFSEANCTKPTLIYLASWLYSVECSLVGHSLWFEEWLYSVKCSLVGHWLWCREYQRHMILLYWDMYSRCSDVVYSDSFSLLPFTGRDICIDRCWTFSFSTWFLLFISMDHVFWEFIWA